MALINLCLLIMFTNFDASFKSDSLQGGIGLIVRNCAGSCMGARTMLQWRNEDRSCS